VTVVIGGSGILPVAYLTAFRAQKVKDRRGCTSRGRLGWVASSSPGWQRNVGILLLASWVIAGLRYSSTDHF